MSTPLPSSPSSAEETWLDADSANSEPAAPPAPPARVEDPLLGTTLLDAYVVDKVLGEGGMGRIYEAHHARLPAKRFAVKALRPELLSSPNVRARFEREVEAVSRITHPGVVGISDVGTTALGLPFMVCEHLSGLDLLAYLRRFGPLSNDRIVFMGCRIAEALEAAHAQGVIHRDIKPSNIFLLGAFEPLGPEWDRVKLIDFGLSRVAGRDDQLTATGIVMGTPAYMAPEQARGARTDPRTDIYGVGAVLYAAATGGPPFREKTPQQTLLAVMGQEPVRPRDIVPGLSEGLELIIQRAMSKEPENRYPSMSALRLALSQLELATPTAGSTFSLSYATAPRGVRARFAALAVSAMAVAAGAIASLVQSAPARDASWTPLERAALLALAGLALLGLARALRRFRARVWSNTATLSDVLPRLQAPLFAGLLAFTLTALVARLAGDQLLEVARSHGTPWGDAPPLPPTDTLPAAAALLVALAIAAHQTWWVPLRPFTRWVSAPALAALLVLAALAPMHWRWLVDSDDDAAPDAVSAPADPGAPSADRSAAAANHATSAEAHAAVVHPAIAADAGAPARDAGSPATKAAPSAPISPEAEHGLESRSPAPTPVPAPAPLPTPPATLMAAPAPAPMAAPAALFALTAAEVALASPAATNPEGFKAELLAHVRRPGEIMAALQTIERWLELTQSAGADPDVRRTLRMAASIGGEPAQAAFRIMTGPMGSYGPDLLYQMMLWQPSVSERAKFLLSRTRVRKQFSPELAIAYDLRFSPSCSARVGLLPRASEVGDQRTINILAALVTPTPGCGEPDHPPCLELCEREAPQFARTVDAIVRRVRGSERAASAN